MSAVVGPSLPVLDQLQRCGVLRLVTGLTVNGKTCRFVASKDVKQMLDADERFAKGILHGLHDDVGEDLRDYRSFNGSLGKGSLQIVLDVKTYAAYADVDKHNPYQDVVRFVGHTGEVIGNWFKGVFRRKPKEKS